MQGVDSELEDTRKTEREEQVKDKCSSGRQSVGIQVGHQWEKCKITAQGSQENNGD